jgi:hypothetical protein
MKMNFPQSNERLENFQKWTTALADNREAQVGRGGFHQSSVRQPILQKGFQG